MRRMAIGFSLALGIALTTAPTWAQSPGGGSGVTSELERTSSTSPEEKTAYAEAGNNEIAEAEKTVSKLLEAAKREGNTEAVQCITTKLTSLRALQQVSEAAEASMLEALEAGNDEKASHEFRKVAVAVSKTRMLLAEAQRCDQDQTLDPGVSVVEWETTLDEEAPEIDLLDIFSDITFEDPPGISIFL